MDRLGAQRIVREPAPTNGHQNPNRGFRGAGLFSPEKMNHEYRYLLAVVGRVGGERRRFVM